MQQRQLGRSGLRVSTMALGTATFGGVGGFARVGSVETDEARSMVDAFLEAGGNLIDTADAYSDGRCEEIVGEVLEGRRDDVLIATKARFAMGAGPNDAGLSRHHLIRAVEASLTRLRTDHIDLYQLHEWDGVTPVEEFASALDDLVRAGKIRYVGVSNFAGWQLMKSLAAQDAHGWTRFVSQQINYTLQSRDAEAELVPLSVDQGLGILIWGPLAGGLLSGKYRRDSWPKEGRHLTDWGEPPVRDAYRLYATVDALTEIGEAHEVSAAQVALAWLLAQPAVTSVILGARRLDQLTDNLAAASLTLTTSDLARLEQVSRPSLPYPQWHQVKHAADRLGPADLAGLRPYLGPSQG
ncbi:aldo/keto reductase [Actinotalea sp. M2MS4P-6]|uniref:aldo/keto reductase n=1 Tax=Actinotalea sp. M2MS4P-6 TaxID=2983762 RepID=UPI0021E493DE|nr:aldo/keto reductase [Actinotalea sp. M2MS4P-6]MCV2393115.1 aldo/keto reductase [Actinotalea sp. M2MS4P-6]